MKNIGTHFFAPIPFKLIDALGDGDITPSMLAVMTMLYRWANWKTGKVNHTSAGAIAQFSQGKWSERTIQDAMSRLEELGYITRHFKPGSHKWYPVTLHNYIASVKHPVLGPDGKPQRDADGRFVTTVKMEAINVKKIKGWDEDEDEELEELGEDCADCSDGSSDEGSDGCSDDSSDEASEDSSDNTNYKRSRHNRKLSGKNQTDPSTITKTGRSKSKSKLNSVSSSKQEIQEWAEEIAKFLEPDKKYHGDSVKRLLDFLSTADESARTCISDAVSEPLVMARLNKATGSKMGYLIDSVRKGYVTQWLEKAEREREKQAKGGLMDAAAFQEEEGRDDEDSAPGKPEPIGNFPDEEIVESPEPPKPKGCARFNEACHCPECELFRSRRAFIMEDQGCSESIAGKYAGWKWKELGQGHHEAIEARYEAWKAKKASAA